MERALGVVAMVVTVGLGGRGGRRAEAGDEPSCTAAGGSWLEPGWCACPTGQGDCPCERASDCLSGCRADEGVCEEATSGRCAPDSNGLGCHCWLTDDGPSYVCAD